MNNSIKFLKLTLVLVASFTITSCVQDDDYTVPTSLGDEENLALESLLTNATEVSFDYAKALYNSDPNDDGDNSDAIPFAVENAIYVKGYVSSSDQTGNFYKELYIQNSAENPTSAMKIVLDQTDNYNQFNKGREVYINLTGLFIGEERTGSGIITLGGGTEFDQYGGTVTSLNFNQIAQKVLRSGITEEIVPLVVSFSEINDTHVGMFVQIDDVEFADDLNGLRYFDPIEVYDTSRTLQVCNGFNYDEFILETSSFADFKEYLLPTGNGSIKAVVSKTYDASSYILALNSVDDVSMDGPRCTLASTIFEERFDDAVDGTDLDTTGWTNYAEAGGELWTEQVYNSNGYAEFTAYGTGNSSNIGWLITPGIDLDTYATETLAFQTEHAYPDAGHDALEVLISTDWDGTTAGVTSATWTVLEFTSSLEADFESWYTFTNSGNIDLSSYSGTGYIAFRYTGSDTSNLNTTMHVDNVAVFGE
ncbi:hypothetical protein HNV10_14720 [Winogradskyella litoriviva]|uniref:DUF5689 domain-containing protein n=1 Tax=Winogradskyella litoriviva TaxID=1220182 RepID=A0ABX2E7L0_9FLAO|nr:DUF5689 domain-containing protein [Winogradskyella litoriviva]NRD24509.1 hypothetical protein [Winogradskyella litoriviva]